MLIEFGNTAAHRATDKLPRVTTVHIPEADDDGLGGYTHEVGGLSVEDFNAHRLEVMDGATLHLPDHEILVSATNGWASQGMSRPSWVRVLEHELTPANVADDVEKFLRELYHCDDEPPAFPEETHWTRFGPPGSGPKVPPITNLYTDSGRVQTNLNDGGGQVGYTSAVTGATGTTLTNSGASWTTNQWAGYRVYAWVSSGSMVWGNVLSNSATVLTVDRWYAPATPGGSAGTTPGTAGGGMLIADGGMVSAWFVGLTTTNITPAHGDTTMSGEYTTGGGGFIRKISPYAQTAGTTPRGITLTPVYTGNGSDTYPQTFYAMGAFTSMVVGSAGCMRFETSLNASATVAISGDQVTVTESVAGS